MKRIEVDFATVQQRPLVDIVTNWSRNVFVTLGMLVRFITQVPDTWNSMDEFKATEAIVRTAVTNDHAETRLCHRIFGRQHHSQLTIVRRESPHQNDPHQL